MEKNVAGKWVVFAYGLPDHASAGQPITGDAANITANMRIDGAAANAIDDTNPTELEDGFYIFDITAAEANGDHLLLTPQSATSDVQVIGVPATVWTRPANFNTLGIETDGDVTKVNLCASNTDMYNSTMRGTDSALTDKDGFTLSTAGILAVWHQALSAITTAGSVGKLVKDEITAARMAVLTDWIDGGRLDLLLDAIPTTPMRGTDGAYTGTPPTVAQIVAGILPVKNATFSDIEFLMVDETDGITPEPGLSVSVERSIDGGAFAAGSNSVAEVSDGIYQYDASAADMNGDKITFRFFATGALDSFVVIRTGG